MDLPPIGDWLDARDVKWAEDAGRGHLAEKPPLENDAASRKTEL